MRTNEENEPYAGFEQGPIRPLSESGSLLIRVTETARGTVVPFAAFTKIQTSVCGR
jgi:hypothetical protein